jgi:hypothetical protein
MIGDLLKLGWDHILDPDGFDHMLFVAVLCSGYLINDWRKVIILVTAFTIGHSITLALAAYRHINIDASLIETLIPLTIIGTALFNLYQAYTNGSNENQMKLYTMASIFGLIHGIGFSNFFKELYGPEESIIQPLLLFNLGVELGQIAIVAGILLLSYIFVNKIGLNKYFWNLSISVLSILVSLWILSR